MLEVRSISKRLGSQTVLDNVSLGLRPGEVIGLVGMNGAGKTTLLDVLSCKISPDSGEVWADGQRIVPRGWFGHPRTVFRTYQVPRLFRQLSVTDNLLMGRWALTC